MSHQQLLDLMRQEAELSRYYRERRPLSCPNDGTVLQELDGGVLHCLFDGWQYPRDWTE
jgi:hypothetical protein